MTSPMPMSEMVARLRLEADRIWAVAKELDPSKGDRGADELFRAATWIHKIAAQLGGGAILPGPGERL